MVGIGGKPDRVGPSESLELAGAAGESLEVVRLQSPPLWVCIYGSESPRICKSHAHSGIPNNQWLYSNAFDYRWNSIARRKYFGTSAIRSPISTPPNDRRKDQLLLLWFSSPIDLSGGFSPGDVRNCGKKKRGILETGREHLDQLWVNSRQPGSSHPSVHWSSPGCKRSDRPS
jgi:hypothetical protein